MKNADFFYWILILIGSVIFLSYFAVEGHAIDIRDKSKLYEAVAADS